LTVLSLYKILINLVKIVNGINLSKRPLCNSR